jgi:hypothetical protein
VTTSPSDASRRARRPSTPTTTARHAMREHDRRTRLHRAILALRSRGFDRRLALRAAGVYN